MKKKTITLLMLCFLFLACQSNKKNINVSLNETQDTLCCTLTTNTSVFIKSLSIFADSLNREFMVFQSNENPEIYVYRLEDMKLVKIITFQKEGADGIGPKAAGFMFVNWHKIYVPNLYKPEISVIDSSGHKLQTIDLIAENPSYPFIPTRSVTNNLFTLEKQYMYCMQLPNPRLGEDAKSESPVEIRIDLEKNRAEPLSLKYPSEVMENYSKASLGIEQGISRCFDGENFVYSFAFSEDLYIVSENSEKIKKCRVKSKYIDELKLPENIPSDFNLAVKMMCEYPFYGGIIYDRYRHLYYRFAYPKTELSMKENFAELWQSGRNQFSVIILNEEFNIIGETLLPMDRYRSDLYFISKNGLYISKSHYKNPSFNEDILAFTKFEVLNRE